MKVLTVFVITALVVLLCMLSCSDDSRNNPVGTNNYETCKVTGKVVDFFLGGGLGDVTIIAASCNPGELTGDTFFLKTTVTDDNGDYSFAGLPKGDYILKAFKYTGPNESNWVIGPGEMHITVRDSIVVVDDFLAVVYSEDNFIIAGKVTNINNMPVFGVKVKIAGKDTTWSATSGASGFFSYYQGKEGETYSVVPEKEGFDYIFTPDICYVTVDEHLEICNFSAVNRGEPLHSISGRLVNLDGSPIGASNPLWGPYVLIENEIIGKAGTFLDYQGAYHFNDLKDGMYTVNLRYRFVLPYKSEIDSSFVIEIQGEDVIVPDIKVNNPNAKANKPKTNYKVYGRIIDSDGNAINDVKVHYDYYGKQYFIVFHTQTDIEGKFGFDAEINVQTGRNYFVYPEKNGWSFSPDTAYVNLKWIEGVEQGDDIIIPDFTGHDHTLITASDYFPLNIVTKWTYIRTENDEEPHDLSINLAAKISHDGQMYHRFSEPGPWNFTDFRIEDNSVYAFSDDEDMLFLKFGVVPGTQWESGVIAGTYTRKGTFLGTETVETSAGIFENCAHFETTVPYGETSFDSYDLWYASGVGLVRSVKIEENYGRRLEYVVDKFKEYEIP